MYFSPEESDFSPEGSEFDFPAVDKSGTCEESENRRLCKQLKEIYEDTIQKIDDELGSDGTEIKLKLMQSRISDLEEQQAMLLQTIDDFLEKSASSTSNQELQDRQTEKLKNEINNLLIFIRRVREEATWDATGLDFNEVSHEDLFGPEDMFSGNVVSTVCDTYSSAAMNISVEITYPAQQNQSALLLRREELTSEINSRLDRLRCLAREAVNLVTNELPMN